jgi:hypothetical protein
MGPGSGESPVTRRVRIDYHNGQVVVSGWLFPWFHRLQPDSVKSITEICISNPEVFILIQDK